MPLRKLHLTNTSTKETITVTWLYRWSYEFYWETFSSLIPSNVRSGQAPNQTDLVESLLWPFPLQSLLTAQIKRLTPRLKWTWGEDDWYTECNYEVHTTMALLLDVHKTTDYGLVPPTPNSWHTFQCVQYFSWKTGPVSHIRGIESQYTS